MLTLPVIHPALLGALARAGHGSTILIADGNYPHETGSARTAERIYLNFAPGLLTVSQVLRGVTGIVGVERARVMRPADGTQVPVFAGYERLLGGMALEALDRFAFYETARERDLAVLIATGDQQHYANILLTVGAAANRS
jgi:L-fucose mutarotase